MDALTHTRPAGPMTRLAQRRPLTAFLLLGLPLAYALVTIWGLAYHDKISGGGLADALHIAPDELAGAFLILSLFPASLFVTHANGGPAAVRQLLRRSFAWRRSPGWWLAVLIPLPALTVSFAVLAGDDLRDVNPASFVISQVALLFVNLVVINLWEETAWTGVFQTRLEQRHGLFVAAALTAIPFAAVHVPLAFFEDEAPSVVDLAVMFIAFYVLGLIVRPMLAVVRRATYDSLLLVGLLHTVFNRSNNDNGIAAKLVDGELREVTILVACIVVAVTIRVMFRARMTKQWVLQHDDVPGVPAGGSASEAAPKSTTS